MSYLLVLTTLAAVGCFRAYRVAARKVRNRDAQLTVKATENASLRAELILTRESCDELIRQNRALSDQARGYQGALMRRAAPTTADIDSGLVEEITAYLGTLPATDDRENPL
ncbi:hypothetical protein ACWD69_09530 [Micromonospora chokoriensis]